MKLDNSFRLKKVGDDYILIDAGSGRADLTSVFSLNESVAWLWNQLIGKDFTEETAVDLICGEYDVSREVASTDVHKIMLLLKAHGMIV